MRSRRLRIAPGYRTEAELCEDVVAWARAGDAAVYPECSGWDVLLVAPSGEQIGVQAKLKPGVKVIEQALDGMRANAGPDIVAIAIPLYDVSLDRVITALDMTLLAGVSLAPRGHWTFGSWMRNARRRATTRRCWVPEVEVALPCGVPSPRTLSPWKFGAAKLCARLRAGDVFTRREVAELGLDVQSWVKRRWMRRVGTGSPARYALHPVGEGGAPLPDRDFPEIVEALGLPRASAEC